MNASLDQTNRRRLTNMTVILAMLLFAALYVGSYYEARAFHLLVRTPSDIKSDGLVSCGSNRIISCRGPFFFIGVPAWYLFYPVHKMETWYRNRPEYFFRNHHSTKIKSKSSATSQMTVPASV
jgi:hypothetical protein